ncbi:TetR/AcrR family transcriptional regulator [Stackebrandtia soli]|uniref:TetR/AcrR family transcriptional regulator n=1 Tax=Stackebrandtia soli TaxID=1892856 RepID=UPI0039E8F100
MTDDTVPIWLRPERSGTGRPAERSRAEITAAAVVVADRGGLSAVSMRNVAVELGTGAASLYRYVASREDLLDLMIDATAAEYRLEEPTGNYVHDLVSIAEQAYAIMTRHVWLPELVVTRPTLGPNGIALLEHVLDVLADHLVDGPAKLEIFALMNATVATFARNALAESGGTGSAQAAYLAHVAADGRHPRISALMSTMPKLAGDVDVRRRAALTAMLTGLLERR